MQWVIKIPLVLTPTDTGITHIPAEESAAS